MVNKILEELKYKLNEIASGSNDSYISIGLSTQFISMNNIVKADEILISENEININSNNFEFHFIYGKDINIDYGVDEYCINYNDMNLYVCLLGA